MLPLDFCGVAKCFVLQSRGDWNPLCQKARIPYVLLECTEEVIGANCCNDMKLVAFFLDTDPWTARIGLSTKLMFGAGERKTLRSDNQGPEGD